MTSIGHPEPASRARVCRDVLFPRPMSDWWFSEEFRIMQLRAAAWYWIDNPDVTMPTGPSLAATLEG